MSTAAHVLITGARAPVALDLARQFAAAGWQVHTADTLPAYATTASPAVHRHHTVPPPRSAPAAFAQALAAICHAHPIALVVPTCEEVFYLAHGRDRLPAGVRVACPPLPLLRSLHSKLEFIALAARAGLRVPASQAVTTLAQARAWAGSTPLVLKPEFSRFGVEVRLYPDGLPARAPELDGRRWVAQHLLGGQEVCSYAVADSGRLLAHAAYRPAYRMARSASYYFDPVQLDDIGGQTAALVGALGYSGQIAFDWLVDAQGRATVIECNPRATSAIHLFAGSDALVQALSGQASACREPGTRAAMLAPLMWLHAGPLAWLGGRGRRWQHDVQRADDVLARGSDRGPRLGVLRDLAHYAWLGLRRGQSLRAASTLDIEWDGSELP